MPLPLTPLLTVDPHAADTDLEPLAERLRAARVVAIGESAHHVREYGLLRHRLTRFLVERCGFTAFGLESGFSEGRAVDAWIRGDGADDLDTVATQGITYRMGRAPELRAQLRWMRAAGVPFVGLDVPGSNASALPGLHAVRRRLDATDPDGSALLDRVLVLAEKFAGEHTLPALRAYAQLDPAERDALTAGLADLGTRLDVHGADPDTRHELRLVSLLDQGFRAQAAADVRHAGLVARDRGMAETVLRTLDRLGPDSRMVIAAANSHIQRLPVHGPGLTLTVAGVHLAAALGEAYLAVAVTATAGTTTTRRPAADAPGGVEVVAAELDEPAPGTLEATVSGPAVVDLAAGRGGAGPDRIRVIDSWQPTPVLDAFDLAVVLPEISPSATG